MKKLYRAGLSLALALMMLLAAGADGIRAWAASPPQIHIDSPSGGGYITGTTLNIAGWAVNRTGIKAVQVTVNGALAANTATGVSRPDVGKAYGGYAGASLGGFKASFNTASYAPGTYRIQVTAIANGGGRASTTLKLTKAAPQLHLDTPKGNVTVSGDLTVSGWSVGAAGVREVDVLVDGAKYKAAAGLPRADVEKAINARKSYQGAANAGFSLRLPYLSALAVGSHQVKVTSVGGDGGTVSSSFTATVKSAPAYAVIDSSVKFMQDTLTVTGWSVNTSGVKSVTVYIDGAPAGNAATGLASAGLGSSVGKSGVYPGVLTAGYSFTVSNTASYAEGNHALKVESVGNDGTVYDAAATVVKLPARIHIDVPRTAATVSGDFTVAGWAVAPGSIQSVQMTIDGKAVGTASTGLPRADVQRVLAAQNGGDGYKDAAESGFTASVDLDTIPDGSHTLTLTATDVTDGTAVTASRNITVSKPQPQSAIETPTGSDYMIDELTVTGWSVSGGGVKNVEVYLDGQDLGSAAVGVARSDIAAKLSGQGYKYTGNTGFTFTKTGLGSIATGSHTVKIISTGNDGDQSTSTATVVKAAATVGFDAAYQNYTAGNADFTLTGYALSTTGIAQVQLYCGDKLLGTSTAPQASIDIQSQYDPTGVKYVNSAKARYSFSVSIDSVPHGAQIFRLVAANADGSTSQGTTTVTVGKPAPLGGITSPASGASVTGSSSVTITGWALNASGVASVSVWLDGTMESVTAGQPSPTEAIEADPNGLYKNDLMAGFTTASIDITGLSSGTHTIQMTAVGNDGDSFTVTQSFTKAANSYTQYTVSLASMVGTQQKLYATYPSSWGVSVSQSDVDPTAITSADDDGIYEFMNLQYTDSSITAAQINAMLDVKGVSNNVLAGQGQAFIDAAGLYHINPVYLAAHARVETGNGTSTLAKGLVYPSDGKTYYNMFGIGAVDSNVTNGGLAAAHKYGWNSVYNAIVGGASFIHDHYIFAGDMGHPPTQNTLYKMKWDPQDVENGKTAYEYATDSKWAHSIAKIICENAEILSGTQVAFDIPLYS